MRAGGGAGADGGDGAPRGVHARAAAGRVRGGPRRRAARRRARGGQAGHRPVPASILIKANIYSLYAKKKRAYGLRKQNGTNV